MPPLLCTACCSVFSEYTFENRWTVSGVKNEPRSFVVHPTLGILARFQAFLYASAFFQLDGVPPPAPARVPITAVVKGFPKIDFL
jgi:hypothetical protein